MPHVIFILSSPSGTGKTSLAARLLKECPFLVKSISYTTRPKREGEVEGKDYFFVSDPEFDAKKGDFLEEIRLFSHRYATSYSQIQNLLKTKDVLLIIDTQGAMKVMQEKNVVSIFISPPSFQELEARLQKRGSENEEEKRERLQEAKKEMEMLKHYDYHIINDDFEKAYVELKQIVTKEHERRMNG